MTERKELEFPFFEEERDGESIPFTDCLNCKASDPNSRSEWRVLSAHMVMCWHGKVMTRQVLRQLKVRCPKGNVKQLDMFG